MVGLQAGLLLGCLGRNSQGISVEDWQRITLMCSHKHTVTLLAEKLHVWSASQDNSSGLVVPEQEGV